MQKGQRQRRAACQLHTYSISVRACVSVCVSQSRMKNSHDDDSMQIDKQKGRSWTTAAPKNQAKLWQTDKMQSGKCTERKAMFPTNITNIDAEIPRFYNFKLFGHIIFFLFKSLYSNLTWLQPEHFVNKRILYPLRVILILVRNYILFSSSVRVWQWVDGQMILTRIIALLS